MPFRRSFLFVGLVSLLATSASANPEIPGETPRQPIALVGATIHPISGPSIPDGTLIFAAGKITAVGKNVPLPPDAEKRELRGKHVYPGIFQAAGQLGLVEVDAVRATRDEHEVGALNPNVKSQVAFNPDSELIPVTRSNGVLLAHVVPTGGLIAGQSSVMQLDGWTYEDMTVLGGATLALSWPRMAVATKAQLEGRDATLKQIREAFANARAYLQARRTNDSQPFDARWEAFAPVLDGKRPLLIAAEEWQQIQAAVGFAAEQRCRLIIFGGYDAVACADLLKKHDVPVIVAGVYRMPRRDHEDNDAAYTLPDRLRQAGVKFCIAAAGRFAASEQRNVAYHAGMAVAHGLPRELAVRAITLSPAEILGVADRVGSLDVGKDATLLISDGDPLEATTHIESAFIQGRPVDLNDRHKRLWKKYEEKYRRMQR